jgi:hypothetical protein
MGAAIIMAHDAVEPVPLFIRALEDLSPARPDHGPVAHPPRTRLIAPDHPITDVHLKAATGVLRHHGDLLTFRSRVDVDRPVLIPEIDRYNVRLPAFRKPDPADRSLVQDSLDPGPVRDLAVLMAHNNQSLYRVGADNDKRVIG